MGDIPEHWDVARLKYIAKLGTGHTPSRQSPEYWVDAECTIPWVTLADVWQLRDGGRTTTINDTAEKISDVGLANSAAVLHPAGTVILSRTASVGFSAILGVDAATSQDFMTWTCGPRLEPMYLLYVLRAMKQEFRRLVMGSTHKTIYMPDIERLTIPLPPLEEQRTIIKLIEHRVAAIDALLASKARLRQLVDARRIQVVREATFAGIDKSAETRPASSALGGVVPEHWRRIRLKYLFASMRNGTWGEDPLGEDGIVCVRVADFDRRRSRVKTDNLTLRSVPLDEQRKLALQSGDILLEKSGGGEQQPVGASVLFDHAFEAVCSNFIARLRPADGHDPEFLSHLLSALYEARVNVPFIKQTTGIQNLDAAAFFAQAWDVPDLAEQRSIAAYLRDRLAGADALGGRLEGQTELLQTHRDTLIYDAVTGRLQGD